MPAGFTRRYGYFPSLQVITAIEGVVIVDQPPPAPPVGVGSGVVAMAAEFPDQTYAVSVVGGVVTANPQPVQIFSGTDLINKTGPFDPTIGDFGQSEGNGFVSLRNKAFSTLVVVPVSILTSSATAQNYAVRMWRLLPGCSNATAGSVNPLPIVPVQGYSSPATTQFLDATNNRVNQAGRVSFSAKGAYGSGVNATAAATTASGNTQLLTFDTGVNFTALGANALNAKVGDIVVIGSTVGGVTLLGSAGTNPGASPDVLQLRVTAVAPSGNNTLTVEMMNGSAFDFASAGWSGQPWRIHPASDADSAGVAGVAAASGAATGYTVPARALDATITSTTAPLDLVNQVAVAYAQDATWLPSNGLTMMVQPGVGKGPVYISGVTAANAADEPALSGAGTPNSAMDANYNAAIQALLQNAPPQNTVNIVFSSRHSAAINKSLQVFVDAASANGIGRVACIAPVLGYGSTGPTVAPSPMTETLVLGPNGTATGQFDEAVGAIRDNRVIYSWPGVQTSVPELVNTAVHGSDGSVVTNGVIDVGADGWLAAVLSNLNPECNPGQVQAPVPQVLAPVLGYQRGVPPPGMPDYMAFKANGICAPRMDATVGPIFQSGVTTAFNAALGTGYINQQRFNDFIDDSLAAIVAPLQKAVLTPLVMDTLLTECEEFLDSLLSPNNPAQQRIAGFSIDDVSGNTQAQEAAGVFVLVNKVQMLPTADDIVLQNQVSPNVVLSSTVSLPG